MYRLTSSMPYLLNRLGVRLGALFSQRIEAYGITLQMYRVLAALLELPDQKLSEISAVTSIELSTMSRLIGNMATKGLVTRVRLPHDERTVRINLTKTGAALAQQLIAEAQHYEDVAVSVLATNEVDEFKATLEKIYRALDVLEEELVAAKPRGRKRAARA